MPKQIIKNIRPNGIQGFSDYIRVSREVNEALRDSKSDGKKSVKISILSSFTIKGLKEVLSVKCFELGLIPDIYIGDYSQYTQEILDKNSEFNKFNSDLVILFIDTRALLGEYYFNPYGLNEQSRRDLLNEKEDDIYFLVKSIRESMDSKIVLHNFEVPLYSPLGILEGKQNFGFIESIETLNINIREEYKKDNQVFVFDYNGFCSKLGVDNIIDYKMYYMGDIKLDFKVVPFLCNEYISYVKPICSINKKCVVLDLDNTLWGGVVGEDGVEGIKVGPTPEGRSFLEFQKYLLSLFNRGIILAINSKNNLDDAMKAINEHPDMILREKHFASIKINWNDKATNIREIADEINIGLDSLVFVDDDKLNREVVSLEHPEVAVVKLPEDTSLYLKTISELNDFNTLSITTEDKMKGKMYSEQRKRNEHKGKHTDINDYLRKMEMEVSINEADSFSIPRISQLSLKTNQFNLTTKRYSEQDIEKIVKEGGEVYAIKVKDKFGDNGIAGVLILKELDGKMIVDTFLLSCRVIGRRIEESVIAFAISVSKKRKLSKLVGEFISTKKNTPAKDFYKKFGFILERKVEDTEVWSYNTGKRFKAPEFIKIIQK